MNAHDRKAKVVIYNVGLHRVAGWGGRRPCGSMTIIGVWEWCGRTGQFLGHFEARQSEGSLTLCGGGGGGIWKAASQRGGGMIKGWYGPGVMGLNAMTGLDAALHPMAAASPQ